MSHYIAGGLMIILMFAVALLGLEAYSIYDAARMVEDALLDGQLQLAADGGVSDAVRQTVRKRVQAEGGDPDRLTVRGSLPGRPFGEPVTLKVVYDHPFSLPLLGSAGARMESGNYRVERVATTMSGWQP